MFGNSVFIDGKISFIKYQELLNHSRQIKLFLNSLLLGTGVSLFSLVIGLPLGICLSRTDIYLRRYLRHTYLLPLLTPPFIVAIGWIELFPSWFYGLPATIFVLGLSFFPFVTILVISGLVSVNRELEDAGRLVHPELTVLRKITLPLIKPNIIAGVIFIFIFALSSYSVPSLLRLNTYPIEIFAQFSAFYDPQKATALAVPLLAVTLILIYIARYIMGERSYVSVVGTEKPKIYALGKSRLLIFVFVCALVLISVIIPIIMLMHRAGELKSYKIAFKTGGLQIINTLILAAIAATVVSVISFFIGYLIERKKGKMGITLETVSMLLFAVPATAVGISLISFWNQRFSQFIYASWIMIIIGYTVRFLPFGIRVASASIKKVPQELEEAAGLVKMHWLGKLKSIVLPLTHPALIVAWIITFVLAIGELETTLLIIPAGETTLPIRIFTLMHYGANKLVAALSIILVAIGVIPLILIPFFRKKRIECYDD